MELLTRGLAALALALGLVAASACPSRAATLTYCGFIGGAAPDWVAGVAVDATGSAYVTGQTASSEATFPAGIGPDATYRGGATDAFVARVSPDGSALIYAGYIGGADADTGQGIAVDASGNAFVAGNTRSSEATFPVSGGPDSTYNDGGDAFVARVRAGGASLDYCGYVGGSSREIALAIAVDGAGSAYLTGATYSSQLDFPVRIGPGVSHSSPGLQDVFVARVEAGGTGLGYAGFVGGDADDAGLGVAVDGAGNAYLAGSGWSTEATFPVTAGPDLTYNGGAGDAFVIDVKADGSGLVYCGYIGGDGIDDGRAIAVDAGGSVYVTGWTESTEASFPLALGPDLTYNGGNADAFVTRVSPGGSSIVYSGYLGGDNSEYGAGIAVHASGDAFIVGSTLSSEATFPVAFGPDLVYDSTGDAFVARVKADGQGLVYAGYVGGTGAEVPGGAAAGVAVDAAGAAYLGSGTSSANTFPVTVGPDLDYNGASWDGFVAKVPFNLGACGVRAQEVRVLQAVKPPGMPADVDLRWQVDPIAAGYNVWYVKDAPDIPFAAQRTSPPAIGVVDCSSPVPAPGSGCRDGGAVPRDAPSVFFYQVRVHCDATHEGP